MPTFSPAFFLDVLSIVLIDVLLGGDNAVVIAMAVKSLPTRQRRLGITIGTGAAVVLRIILTFFAARLLQVRFIELAGGLVVLWIAYKLLTEAAEPEGSQRQVRTLGHAIWLILVADVTMSLDNILAVAGASKGNLALLVFGLALSITFVAFTSSILASLMDRYPVIIWLGSAILGRVGGEMIMSDPKVRQTLEPGPFTDYGVQAVSTVGVLAAAWLTCRRNRVSSAA
jgi:YjbE family integral membrane protein